MIKRTFVPDTIYAHTGPVIVPPQAEVKIQIDLKDPTLEIKEIFYTTVTGKKSVSITDKVIVSTHQWDIWVFNAHTKDAATIDNIVATYANLFI
ncbi:hypothetical protein [Brevibacillus sp. 179-C9.3 HS]|uniref:hypothetical protein n=1 Tax=unclassified Brevibacillus TaxID=2684853 RepID=UPI00399EEDD2